MFRNSLYYPTPSKEICIEVTLWLSLFGYSFFLCQFDFSIQISVTVIVCAWDSKLKLFLAYLPLKKVVKDVLFFSIIYAAFFLLSSNKENYQCRRQKIDKRNIEKVDISLLSFQGVKEVFLQVFANFFSYLRIILALKGLFVVY